MCVLLCSSTLLHKERGANIYQSIPKTFKVSSFPHSDFTDEVPLFVEDTNPDSTLHEEAVGGSEESNEVEQITKRPVAVSQNVKQLLVTVHIYLLKSLT